MRQSLDGVRWLAPAKINRFLHIVGRRDDGYHLLQSVFVLLNIADELEIKTNTSGKINFDANSADLVTADNLCIQAAELLRAELTAEQSGRLTLGADIFLHKNIPVGGGLGGGSSDAATVLLVLNKLWQANLSQSQLMAMGARLGADVPFFIGGRSSWVEGIGEKITPLPEQLEIPVLLILPELSISTISIYKDPNLVRDTSVIEGWADLDLEQEMQGWRNDMEVLVLEKFPELKKLADITADLGNVRMSGSGSTFFVVLENNTEEALLSEVESKLAENRFGSCRANIQCYSGLHQQLRKIFG